MEEEYNQMDHHENSTTTPRGNYLYSSPNLGSNYRRTNEGTNVVSNNNHHHHHHEQQTQMLMNTTSFHLQSDHTDCFLQTAGGGGGGGTTHSIVKTEASTSQHLEKFHYPLLSKAHHQHQQQDHLENDNSNEVDAIKAKIIAHPQYSNILEAFIDCQKVGAPTEVVNRLSAAREDFEVQQRSLVRGRDAPKDPELDQFMEAYYDMLVKYREELTKPIQEAMDFMGRIESQLNLLCNGSVKVFSSDERCEGIGSSEEDVDNNGGETEVPEIDPRAEDRELKNHLLRKYSGYLSSLKQELSKKKKKGKLPKDARQKLLSWWELHYKWPYPSETEKVALAEATGLDQKQINNWFINQRKRHWKPSEDMQFMVMDGLHPQNAALYMDGHYMGDAHYRLGP